MKWKVIVSGKPSLMFARDGVGEYEKRLRRQASVDLIYLRGSGTAEEIEKRYLAASAGCTIMAFDERGEAWSTSEFREVVDKWEMDGGTKSVAIWIGGADGLGDSLRSRADLLVSFGKMTMQHELALVVLLEQLYRVYTLKRGEPYHR